MIQFVTLTTATALTVCRAYGGAPMLLSTFNLSNSGIPKGLVQMLGMTIGIYGYAGFFDVMVEPAISSLPSPDDTGFVVAADKAEMRRRLPLLLVTYYRRNPSELGVTFSAADGPGVPEFDVAVRAQMLAILHELDSDLRRGRLPV